MDNGKLPTRNAAERTRLAEAGDDLFINLTKRGCRFRALNHIAIFETVMNEVLTIEKRRLSMMLNVRHDVLLRGAPVERLVDDAIVDKVLLEHCARGVLQLHTANKANDAELKTARMH